MKCKHCGRPLSCGCQKGVCDSCRAKGLKRFTIKKWLEEQGYRLIFSKQTHVKV